MIAKWNEIWDKYLMKIQADKFLHFIAFREFTSALLRACVWAWVILIIVIALGIGKELWDWNHGRYFDFGDLLADAIGTGLAYIIFYGVRLI